MTSQFAIVTGASNGIGFSLAKELAGRGYDLAICSAGERLQGAADELRSTGVEVTEIQADLATREGVKQFWDEVDSLGRGRDGTDGERLTRGRLSRPSGVFPHLSQL